MINLRAVAFMYPRGQKSEIKRLEESIGAQLGDIEEEVGELEIVLNKVPVFNNWSSAYQLRNISRAIGIQRKRV